MATCQTRCSGIVFAVDANSVHGPEALTLLVEDVKNNDGDAKTPGDTRKCTVRYIIFFKTLPNPTKFRGAAIDTTEPPSAGIAVAAVCCLYFIVYPSAVIEAAFCVRRLCSISLRTGHCHHQYYHFSIPCPRALWAIAHWSLWFT